MKTTEIKDIPEFKALEGLTRVASSASKYSDGEAGETVDTYRFTRDGVVYEVMCCAHADGEPNLHSFPARAYDYSRDIAAAHEDAVPTPTTDLASLEARVINIEGMVEKMLGMMERDAWTPVAVESDDEPVTCSISGRVPLPEKMSEHDEKLLEQFKPTHLPSRDALPEDYGTARDKALNDEEQTSVPVASVIMDFTGTPGPGTRPLPEDMADMTPAEMAEFDAWLKATRKKDDEKGDDHE